MATHAVIFIGCVA